MTLQSQLLAISLLFVLTTITTSISPDSTLSASTPNQTWSSPNNTFSLAFIPSNPPTSPPTFLAAITYAGGVPIWSAGDGSAVDSGGTLHFMLNGNLRLLNGSNAVVWESGTAGRGVSSAELDDSGDLVLRNGTLSIWSSFEHPTDTIVPSQNLTSRNVLRSGLYSFSILSSGNLTLRWNDSTVYWTKGLNSSITANAGNSTNQNLSSSGTVNLTDPYLGLQPIGILSIWDQMLPSPVIMAYSSDYAEENGILRFLKLGDDGNLRIYSSPRGSGTTIQRWAAISDQCQIFGFCGVLGICSYNDSNPICGCPSKNFEPIDAMDGRKGCRRKVEIEDCPGSATMLQLEHAQFLTYPPELSSQVFFVGISACRLNCLVSDSCVASTSLSDGTGLCYLKTPEFLSGYQSPALPSTSYLKVCAPLDPNLPPLASVGNSKGWRLHAWVVAVLVMATILGLVILEGGLWWWCCRYSRKFGALTAQYALLEYASGAPVQFSFKDLQRSTKGFKEKLGAGGFGAVYKGVLANRTIVAVKQLEGIEQGEKQFRMEVATISSTHHLNLVRLIGFCSEGRHRLLVYEFMKNGSLDNFLFTAEEQLGKLLNWESRFNIALGTAKGITYLHEECRDCIVHCDIKPENILLDENFTAKVSDFGLAKLISSKDHRYRTLTSVRGTRGYLAPEWIANLPITAKSDVYSYGMVLLEIVSGKRNFDVSAETNRKKFSIWAYEEYMKGNVNAIIDKSVANQDLDMEQVKRVIQVSFWCIQAQPAHRPMMGKVVQMLEGVAEIERPPDPKASIEGSIGGSSINLSSSVSPPSTSVASAPSLSSSSSFQPAGVSPLDSRRNFGMALTSLPQSEPK